MPGQRNAHGGVPVCLFGVARTGGNYVGFRLPWTEIQRWEAAYVDPTPSGDSSNLEVRAQCWEGEKEERPEPTNLDGNVVNLAKKVTDGEDLVMAGTVPKRSGATKERYTCLLGFEQRVFYEQIDVPGKDNNPDDNRDTAVTVYLNKKDGEGAQPVWERGRETADAISGNYGYIIDGTTASGNIDGFNASIVRPDTGGQSIQDWLADKASTTETVSDPFLQFWKGDRDKEPRHPAEYCEQRDDGRGCS